MFSRIFRRSQSSEVPQQLYGSVVAQARQPVFFTEYGFEDSVTGRFDVLALHLFLFSRRLVREDSDISKSLNQEVFDFFTDDTDRALRELGIGDTSVPKRKKKLVRTFFAMVSELGPVLDQDDQNQLAAALAGRFDDGARPQDALDALSDYVRAAADSLDEIPMATILKGDIAYPDPATYL